MATSIQGVAPLRLNDIALLRDKIAQGLAIERHQNYWHIVILKNKKIPQAINLR